MVSMQIKSMRWENKAEIAAARERLIVEHLPIVRIIARQIHRRLPSQISSEDIYSAGVVGLMEAIDKFEPSKHVLFRTYAQCRIRGAILDNLRSLDWGPRRLRSRQREMERVIHILTGQLQRPPDEFEIAKELQMSMADYHRLLGTLKDLEVGTLQAERSTSSETELAYIPGPPGDDPLFRCLNAEMRTLLECAIASLPERESWVIKLRYYEELTIKEIATVLGVTEARTSQIHTSAVLHLRASLRIRFPRKPPQAASRP